MKHRLIGPPLLALFWLAGTGCLSRGPSASAVYKMGERIEVGRFVYTILETEWRTQIGDKVPAQRFLCIRFTVTNSGGTKAGVPLLTLVGGTGTEYPEYTEVEGLSGWFGLLRELDPAATEDGWIVYDVPRGPYRLRISDGGPVGQEITRLVEIPLHIETGSDAERM